MSSIARGENDTALLVHQAAVQLLRGLDVEGRLLRRDHSERFSTEVWSAVCEAGWLETLMPVSAGGLGLGMLELGSLFRAVGSELCDGPLFEHGVIVPLLFSAAPTAIQDRLRPAVAGKQVLAFVAAPGARSEPGSTGPRIVDRRLGGTVLAVPFACQADLLAVVADNGGEPVVALIESGQATRSEVASADPCVQYGSVSLDIDLLDVDVVLQDASAAKLIAKLEGATRLMIAAQLAGVVSRLTTMTVEYAKSREQFGRPIAGFQAIRHILAQMAVAENSLQNLCDAVLSDADGDPAQLPALGRIAKTYASETARRTAENSLQLHGGIGYTSEHPLHLYFRRCLSLYGYMGEPSDLLIEIGEESLGSR